MEELIKGMVIKIVDDDVFDMKVSHVGQTVMGKYKSEERVKISALEGESLLAKRSIKDLEDKLNGKEVRCHVMTRDLFGRLVATVKVL